MTHLHYIICILSILLVASVGCGAAALVETPPEMPSGGVPPEIPSGTAPPDLPSGQAPPGGSPPGNAPQAGENTGVSSYTLAGVVTIDGDDYEETDGTYPSDTTDLSAIYVTNGGRLTLTNPTIITSGNTSSSDASSFYGLNGAILANNGSTVTITGGSITTTGSGANGVIPTGSGTSVTLTDMTITASGDGGHGVMATLGGTITLTDVDIATTGPHGAPIATDRGSGTVFVTRGTVFSSGADSPGLYSTGKITVTDAVITSEGTEAAVVEGFNSIDLTNTTLTGGTEKTGGIMIYQSFSGDAETGTGTVTMNGGSYTATDGPAFFVTNTDSVILLTGVKVTSLSDTLIKAAGTSRWGTEGENGGTVVFTADGETLSGSLITDAISSINATLKNGSILTGAIDTAALTLDSSSTWIVTGDSTLTSLSDPDGIVDGGITNIIGNGYTVTYDPTIPDNSALEGKTYDLTNGGILTPR
jgi:hypothetical protein